jgi:hypothetical protein
MPSCEACSPQVDPVDIDFVGQLCLDVLKRRNVVVQVTRGGSPVAGLALRAAKGAVVENEGGKASFCKAVTIVGQCKVFLAPCVGW